jgi:hypothetical protein
MRVREASTRSLQRSQLTLFSLYSRAAEKKRSRQFVNRGNGAAT